LIVGFIFFPEIVKQVPKHIIENVTDQLRSVCRIPKALHEFSQEEIDKFPRLFEWFVLFAEVCLKSLVDLINLKA
jgi:hypothetical protein